MTAQKPGAYSAEQQGRILSTLPTPDMDRALVIQSLEAAWERCRSDAAESASLPTDVSTIKRLLQISDVEELATLDEHVFVQLLRAAAYFLKPEVLPRPFDLTHAWLTDPLRRAELAALGADLVVSLAKTIAGQLQEDRRPRPHPIGGPDSWGVRITRRGRPADYAGFYFACCCFVVYACTTRQLPTRRIEPSTGLSFGPFHNFVAAAIEPTGLIDRQRGERTVRPRVDALVRDCIEWLDPNEREPFLHEARFFHRYYGMVIPFDLIP